MSALSAARPFQGIRLGIRCSSMRGAAACLPRTAPVPARSRRRACQASAAGGEEAAPGAGGPDPAPAPGQQPAGSNGGSVSLPLRAVPTAGAMFVLAGVLKLLIMCFPYSPMAIQMYLQGRADLGLAAVIKMGPLALALAAAAKLMVDRKLHTSVWVQRGLVLGGIVLLALSRWIFAQPKPSPLDPMLQAQAAATAAAERRQAEQEQVAKASLPHLMRQPDEAGRKQLQGRGRWN